MLSQYELEVFDDETGDSSLISIPNLRRIRSIGYIKEAIAWNPDINTDRVSAMDMVMILREDRKKYVDKFDEQKEEDVLGHFHDDPFLDDNWKKAMGNYDWNPDTI